MSSGANSYIRVRSIHSNQFMYIEFNPSTSKISDLRGEVAQIFACKPDCVRLFKPVRAGNNSSAQQQPEAAPLSVVVLDDSNSIDGTIEKSGLVFAGMQNKETNEFEEVPPALLDGSEMFPSPF